MTTTFDVHGGAIPILAIRLSAARSAAVGLRRDVPMVLLLS